ncbi:MAG: c-type cytochrome [Gemmatimonadaceae bacterium]
MACGYGSVRSTQLVDGGKAERGRARIISSGCGSCHTIPGVRGARGVVGPNLTEFGLHSFIAGEAPNTPDYLVRWIMNPQQIERGTAMPTLGISEPDARDIAAYLYTLH